MYENKPGPLLNIFQSLFQAGFVTNNADQSPHYAFEGISNVIDVNFRCFFSVNRPVLNRQGMIIVAHLDGDFTGQPPGHFAIHKSFQQTV